VEKANYLQPPVLQEKDKLIGMKLIGWGGDTLGFLEKNWCKITRGSRGRGEAGQTGGGGEKL